MVRYRRYRNSLPFLRERVYEKTDGACAYCGTALESNWHIEHVVPRCRGGGWELGNLVPACKRCNSMKGKKTLNEFRYALYNRLDSIVDALDGIALFFDDLEFQKELDHFLEAARQTEIIFCIEDSEESQCTETRNQVTT